MTSYTFRPVSIAADRDRLIVGPPATRQDAPQSDGFEDGWRTYYESTFNPARLNPTVMRGHMAKKYWKNLQVMIITQSAYLPLTKQK